MSDPKPLTDDERLTLELAGSGPGFDYIPTDEIDRALSRLDYLEAENERLRRALVAEEKAFTQMKLAAEARLATAEAENERLRAEGRKWASIHAILTDRATAAEARLATAVGLLGQWVVVDHYQTRDPATLYGLRSGTRAFLDSAQPAAPYVQPRGKAGQVVGMSESFEYVGSPSSPLPPAFEAANAARQPAAPRGCGEDGGCAGECLASEGCLLAQPAAPVRRKSPVDDLNAVADALSRRRADCDQAPCLGSPGPGCCPPAAVRAPNPEAVARILADPDCAAPVVYHSRPASDVFVPDQPAGHGLSESMKTVLVQRHEAERKP